MGLYLSVNEQCRCTKHETIYCSLLYYNTAYITVKRTCRALVKSRLNSTSCPFELIENCELKKMRLRLDFTSKLVHVLAFGTPKFYIAPYDKIKHELVNLSSNCDVKSGLKVLIIMPET